MPQINSSNHSATLEVRLPRRRHVLIGSGILLPLMLFGSGVVIAGWVKMWPKLGAVKPGDLLETMLVIFVASVLTGITWFVTLGCISGLVQECFSRSLSLNFAERQITLRNVPGLTRVLAFDEIQSLEIVTCRAPKSGHWFVYLCFRLRNRRRLLRLVEVKAYRAKEVTEEKVSPYAAHISGLLGVPVNESVVSPFRTFLIGGF